MQPGDYDRFKPFFSKVLADYHGVAADAKHVNNWSLEGVEGLPEGGTLDLAQLGLPALSMRVRVGRNLADFPLPGAMTAEHRRGMEEKMCAAFAKLISMPEYGGRYHSLTPGHSDFIDDSKYEELVKVRTHGDALACATIRCWFLCGYACICSNLLCSPPFPLCRRT